MDEHMGILVTAAPKPMGYSARQEDIASRDSHDCFPVEDNRHLTVKDVERFVFIVVEMVGCFEVWRCRGVNQRVGAFSRLVESQDKMKSVKKPVRGCSVKVDDGWSRSHRC